MNKQNAGDFGLDGLTRRLLLKSAAGGAALWGTGAWAATTSDTPTPGGILRIAFSDPPRTLDPQAGTSFVEYQYMTMVFDSLTMLDENVQAIPGLAIRWQSENQAKEWVFDLRQGVRFHHGREFTSADVVASVERAQDASKSLIARGYYGPVESVKAEGPHRVRFILTRPFAELPVQLAVHLARILPADRLETQKTEPVGTGPFRFKEMQQGSSLTLEKNSSYWMPDRPYLDGIRMVAIREPVAQQAALRGGAVDLITRIPVEAALILRNVPNLKVYSITTGDHHALITQANLAPFDNPKVRLAFKYIFDRKSLVASILFGQGAPGNDTPIPAGNIYLSDFAQRGQDLEKARALIAESGVGPLELDLYTSSERPPAPKMAIAFAEAAGRIGVKINVRDVPYTEYTANVARKKPMYTSQWTGNATLYEMLYLKYHSTGSYNYSKLEQAPGLDALLDSMLAETDFEKRKAIVAVANEKIRESSERIIPYFLNYVGATSDKVMGFVPPQFNTFEIRSVWMKK